MGGVRTFRYLGLAALIALAAVLVLFARGDSETEAVSFEPSATVRVADPTPGANSDVTTTTLTPLTDAQFSGLDYITFFDPAWEIADDASIPNGSISGSSTSFATLGVLNSFCGFLTFPAIVAFLEATTDTSGRSASEVTWLRATCPVTIGPSRVSINNEGACSFICLRHASLPGCGV